jgi:general secretion pathway protein C
MSARDFSSYQHVAERGAEKFLASRWTPVATTLIALVLLTYSLAQWSWRLFQPGINPPQREQSLATPEADNRAALSTLLSANLFGQTPAGAISANGQLPTTGLNLVLTGILLRDRDSAALIRIEGGDETPVNIGQEILSGARLRAVFSNRAVLERGGILENLPLKDEALPEGAIVSPARTRPEASGIRGSGNQFTVSRDTLTANMQRPEFLSQALMVPNAGGGFLVRQVQPGSVYEKLGVRPGDVIRSVNGQAINNIDEVMKVYQQLGGVQQAGEVSIEVVRAGRAETLQYSIQ